MTALYLILALLVVALKLAWDFEDLAASLGNPLARWLRLQGDGTVLEKYVGRVVPVVFGKGSLLRIEFDGTTWVAKSANPAWTPNAGERVKIVGVDRATFLIAPDEPLQ